MKHLTIKGDSQLLVNFSNKVYEPKDEHVEAYLAEVHKIEKQFLGLELQHVPHGTNKEADDITKRASKRLPQEPGGFEERLFKPSATPLPAESTPPQEELPQPPASGGVLYRGVRGIPDARYVVGEGGRRGACDPAGYGVLHLGR